MSDQQFAAELTPHHAMRASERLADIVCRVGLALLLVLSLVGGPIVCWADDAPPAGKPAPLDCTGSDGVGLAEVKKAQQAWATYLKCGIEETVEVGKGVKMAFVLIPPGKFRMGSPKAEVGRQDAEKLHDVTLTVPFYLGKHPVTDEQYEALTGATPSFFKKGGTFPVETVSWTRSRDYATGLTKRLDDKRVCRLPTEAEWEYACRGGRPSSKPFGVGDGISLSSREANFDGTSPYGKAAKGPNVLSTIRVGSYPANAFGLFDMHGNVRQWCADWYGPYPDGGVINPAGPAVGKQRVFRGGAWGYEAGRQRAAARGFAPVAFRNGDLGFRLARAVPVAGR